MRIFEKQAILLVLLFTFLYACETKENTNFRKLNLEITPEKISGEVLEFEELITPISMQYSSPFLFLNDSKAEKYIHAIDLPNKKYINNFGQKGKGPGEMLSAVTFDVFDNHLWIHDLTLAKLISYELDSITSPNLQYSKEIILEGKARQNFSPKWLVQDSILSTSFSDTKKRLIITNGNGNVVSEKFEMFAPPSGNIPVTIHNQSYQSVMALKPSKEKIAIASRYSDLIEIYDLKNNLSKRIKTHSNYSPVYEVQVIDGYSRMAQDETMRFGYISIAVDDNNIYTIYSGRTRAEGKANYGDIIIVYDWEGNYKKSYQIENRAISIELIDQNQFVTIESVKGKLLLKKYAL